MSAIHFDITGDNKNLVSVINDTTKRMEDMSNTMKDLGKNFDMSSTEAQLEALNDVIEDQEAVLEGLGQQLDELAEKQQQAAEAGDTQAVAEYGRQMSELAGEIKVAREELDRFKTAQQQLSKATEENTETTKKAYGDNVGALEKLVGSSKNYTNILRFLPAPLKKVAMGINSITNAAKAFIFSGVGAALAALAVTLKGISLWINNTFKGQRLVHNLSESFDELSVKITGTSKKIKQLEEATREGAASQVATLMKLQQQWKDANGNLEEQKKILASKDWEKLGVAVKDANDAENVLVNNTPQVINALMARAEAAALYKQAERDIDEYLEARQKLENDNARFDKLSQRRSRMAKTIADNPEMFPLANAVAKIFNIAAAGAESRIVADEDMEKILQPFKDAYEKSLNEWAAKKKESDDLLEALGIKPTDSDYEESKQIWQNYLDYQRRYAEELRRQRQDLAFETEQAAVDALEEGGEKELRQLQLNHEKQLEEIERWYKELREAKIQAAREEFESNPNNKGLAFTYKYDDTKWDATKEENASYNAKIASSNALFVRSTKSLYRQISAAGREALSQSRNYESKRVAIITESQAQINELREKEAELEIRLKNETNDEIIAILEDEVLQNKVQQDNIRQNTGRSLDELERQYSDFYRRLAEDRSEWLVGDTLDLLKDIENELARLGTPDENDTERIELIQRLKRELKELKLELTQNFTARGILNNLLNLNGNSSKNFAARLADLKKSWYEMTNEQRLQVVGGAVTGISNGLQRAARSMQELAQASGDSRIAEMAESLSMAADTLGTIGQGFANSIASGIIATITTVFSQTISAITNAAAQEKIAERNAKDWADEIERLRIAINEDDFNTIFGTKNFALGQAKLKEAQNYIELYYKKLRELNEEYNKEAELDPVAAWNAPDITARFLAAQDAIKKGYDGLQRMLITTKKQTAWARAWGIQDEYTALGELAPQIWDNGEFDVEAARAFLSINTQITDEQRRQIENVIELKDEYDNAIATIDNLISQTFGSLANDISDIIWDSVMNGTDAWENFRETGADVIASLGKQLTSEMLISEYLEQYREQMRSAYQAGSPEETAAQLRNIVGTIFSNMDLMFEAGSAVAEEYKAWMDANGFIVDQYEDQRKAQTRSSLGASQDSIDESNARLTTIQSHTYELNENVKRLVAAAGFGGDMTPAFSQPDYSAAISEINAQLMVYGKQVQMLGLVISEIQQDIAGVAGNTRQIADNSDNSLNMSRKMMREMEMVVDSGVKMK